MRPELIEIAAKPKDLPGGLATQTQGRVLNRIFLGEQTEYRIASDALGEFTVLPGHIPFLTALKAGVLSWKDASGKHLLAVDKGYLQVGADNLTLADSNEEGANLLALQTRQSLSTSALSMAVQADQNVLRLLQ